MTKVLLPKTKNEGGEYLTLSIDRAFKTVFLSEDILASRDYHLLEALISEALMVDNVKIVEVMGTERPVRSSKEKTKRVDFLAKLNGMYVHMELNSSVSTSNIVRNNCFFFSFYSQRAKVGEDYDVNNYYIQISLNYNMSRKLAYRFDSDEYFNSLPFNYLPNLRIIHLNLDKFGRIWYDNDGKRKVKSPLLTLLGIKDRKSLITYSKYVDDENVKECVKKLEKLNKEAPFEWLSPEEDWAKLTNSLKKEFKKIGLEEGRSQGHIIGLKEGRAEGINKIALRMLEQNFKIEDIIKATDLTKEEIEELKNS